MESLQRAAEPVGRKALQEAMALTGNACPHAEFVARMAGGLDTHLNDMLVLAKLLADNPGKNLSLQQIDYAQTIYSIGAHLLSLNDDICASASVESNRYHAQQMSLPDAAIFADNAAVLVGMKVLVVSDDVRTIYAITGLLEQQGMVVLQADSGAAGTEALRSNADTEVVLLDTMVPMLDCRGAIASMRGIDGCQTLPVIALTAMADDREKCIAFGASHTVEMPLNVEQLLSLLRAWMGELR
jgi:CheY-like chemotaxis protein